MENTLFFTLKVAVDVGKEPDRRDVKRSDNVYITMDIGPEFVTQQLPDNNRLIKRNFDFDAVQSILNFVSDELMEKIKAYVYTNYEQKVNEAATAEAKNAEGKQTDPVKKKRAREEAAINLVSKIKDRKGEYSDGYKYERRINKISFQRVPGKGGNCTEKVTYSVDSNGNLPPQGWPPKEEEELPEE